MHGLVVIAVFGFSALVGMLAAAKRPVAAGLALLVGVGWPATLLPGDNPLLAGALALAGMLFILFLFRARGRTLRGLAPALVVGGLLVLAAVGASSTEAVAKGAFLRWQQWDLYDRPDKAVSVSYVWTSNYEGLRFPKKKTIVMRVHVDGPRRPLYWRATVLEDYNGGTWNETGDLSEPKPSKEEIDVGSNDPLLPGAGKKESNWVEQEISIQALRDNHLIASAQPVRWRPATSSDYQTGPSGSRGPRADPAPGSEVHRLELYAEGHDPGAGGRRHGISRTSSTRATSSRSPGSRCRSSARPSGSVS